MADGGITDVLIVRKKKQSPVDRGGKSDEKIE